MAVTIDWGVVLMMVAALAALALYALWPTLCGIARVVTIVWRRRAQLMAIATVMSQGIIDGRMDGAGGPGGPGGPTGSGGPGPRRIGPTAEGAPPDRPTGPTGTGAAARRGRRAMRMPR
jgi:hypothetical protein